METSTKYQLIEKLIQTNDDALLHKVKELFDNHESQGTSDRSNETYHVYIKNSNEASIWDEVNRKIKG